MLLLVINKKKKNQILSLWAVLPKDIEKVTKRSKSISSWLKFIVKRITPVIKNNSEIHTSKKTEKC